MKRIKFRRSFLTKPTCILILFFIATFNIKAQNEYKAVGKISGKIIDSISRQPIEYATISLFLQTNNKLVNGTTADDKGFFTLTNVPVGTYKIRIDFIGYKRIEQKNIVITKSNQNVLLGDIKLSDKQTILNDVTVTADKILVENKIDKIVYNTEKDVTSQGGVASDLLKKVPQVSVDVDGNVELQGNSSIKFLINGKPSVLFGNNITDVLQSIPASQIQSIEVITSPGAKYDAEGTGGIINIILKQNNANGVNGSISLSGGTRLENSSINLNVRRGKFGIHTFFSGNAQLLSTTKNNMDRLAFDTTTTTHLLQNGSSNFHRYGYQTGIGLDWDITPKTNLSLSLNYDYFENENTGSANRQTILQNDLSGNQISNIYDAINTSNKFHEHSIDWDLSYKKKFAKDDQELEISCNSSYGNIFSYYNQTQQNISPATIFNSSFGNNPGIENETNFIINYSQPIGKDVIIETGAKMVLDDIKSTSDVYLLNTTTGSFDFSSTESSQVDYKRTVYAGYLSLTFKLFDFLDIKTGLRDEYTVSKANYSDAGFINLNPYNTLVPSAVISHSFNKNQTLKISYTRRIERPDYRDLNPFINASDPKNITSGNPKLRPEIGDKIELSYNQTFKNGASITPTVFYRGNKDDIQPYTTYYPSYKVGDSIYTNVTLSVRQNIGREDNFGLSLYASIPFTDAINFRTNISCFERYINTGMSTGGNIHGFNYRINMNASYQISKTFVVECSGYFNSPRINAQGTMPAFTTYNFAFRKQMFNKNASFAITATNIFDNYINQKTELTGQNFTVQNTRQLPFRSFGFNFTYKFGKLEFKKEKEPDNNMPDPSGTEK